MTLGSGHGPGGATTPSEPLAYCYRHPGRETGVRCVRCERPICPECMRPASVGFHCPDDVKAGRVRPTVNTLGARETNRPPIATPTLLLANIGAYVACVSQTKLANDPVHADLFQQWQLFPVRVADGEFHRLLTSTFLHVALWHIVVNMLSLLVLGPPLERLLGTWRFSALYALSALGGSTVVYVFGDMWQAVAGASGALYGLFAAAVLLARELRLDSQFLIGTIVLNVVMTLTIPNVSLLGHLGGLVFGALALLALAGPPRSRKRIPTRVQLAGLGGIAALLLVLVVIRTLMLA